MRCSKLGTTNGQSAARPRGRIACLGRVLVAVGAAWCLATPTADAQPPEPGRAADGLVHVSLTLDNQEIHIAFSPDLRAGGLAYRSLLSDTVGSRVRVGTLTAHRALRLGTLAPDIAAIEAEIAAVVAARLAEAEAAESEDAGEQAGESAEDAQDAGAEAGETDERTRQADGEEVDPADPALWLVRDAAGWQLEVRAAEGREAQIVPLSHVETAAGTPAFTASIHATGAETGRLALRWGHRSWSADFRFEELPGTPRGARVSGRGTARVAEDSNEAIARANMLAERNETAMVLPNGASITMLYWKGIDVEDEDYPNVAAAQDGAVIEMIRAPVLRFKSDVALRFGETDIPTGNLAPGFAGAYGIWLRRTGDGWRFVFNHEPDSWGTQYDPDFDAAEITVDYARAAGSFRPLGATLVPTGADRGRLVVHWGPHEWAADFTIPSLASATTPLEPVAAAGAPAAADWSPALRADGQPDITGMWNNSDAIFTPLEMPEELAGRDDIAAAELEERARARADGRIEAFEWRGHENSRGVGGYGIHWFDWFWDDPVAGDAPALIVEPTNGRVPSGRPARGS